MTVIGALLLSALAWFPSASLVARAATTGWTIVSSPNVGTEGDRLNAESCTSTTFCMAGGFSSSAGTVAATLAEKWNGATWAGVTSPNPTTDDEFLGVSCVSTSFCMAVGDEFSSGADQNLAEQWNGTAWSVDATPNKIGSSTENQLSAVSCASTTFCVAVGFYDASTEFPFINQTLVEQWNGTTWSIDSSPNTSGSVSNTLNAVKCASSSVCEAVGFAGSGSSSSTLAESWSGSSWSIVTSPNGSGATTNTLNGIDCTSTTFCVAVGWEASTIEHTLVEQWNGASWSVVSSPNTSSTIDNLPYAVACTSNSFCMLVGETQNGSTLQTLGELWDGTAWAVVATPNASGNHTSGLSGVSCVTVTFCTAAGLDVPPTTGSDTLIEQWNGEPPVVASVSPAAGPVAGGQVVTVTGSGFSAGMSVTVGGTSVTPSNITAASFTFTTPAESAGYVQVQVTTSLGASALTTSDGYMYAGLGNYVPITPFRILDTRPTSGIQRGSGALGAGTVRALQIIGVTGLPTGTDPIPSTASAVVLNVTAVDGTASSLLTVYPTGTGRPNASNLNFTTGTVTPNLVTAVIGQGGSVNIYNAVGTVNVLADVEGYFEPQPSSDVTGEFHPISPVRVCDTRMAQYVCAAAGELATNVPRLVNVTGVGANAIPASGAAAAVFNLTGVAGTTGTFLSVYPPSSSGACATPNVSTLNLVAGQVQANRVMVSLGPATSGGPDTSVCVYNASGKINAILDANGWFGSGTAAAGEQYQPIGPSRVCDTRTGSGLPCAGHALTAGGTDTIAVAGVGGVPPSSATHPALAVIANLTAIDPSTTTYLTLYAADLLSTPGVSDLNVGPGEVLPNLAVVQLDTTGDAKNGDVTLFNSVGEVNSALDIEGWFQ
jgi:hypothetical protein